MNYFDNKKSSRLTETVTNFFDSIRKSLEGRVPFFSSVSTFSHQWLKFLTILLVLSFAFLGIVCKDIDWSILIAFTVLVLSFLITIVILHNKECRFTPEEREYFMEKMRNNADKHYQQ
uniref:Uncharacterized protein n=1 Tax=Candidatus Kentrum sp. TC TaxID=2126339 RepID=A0A450YHV4_9GAMM|nr:MAG: hypothetical protein BECKTC1821E_GA0114239_100968 [Candidatus Kentron sp. TC]